MHVSNFVLNHDGIHCTVAMPGRDQLGRFMGEQDGDDEQADDCLISIFTLVAETICNEDDLTDSDEDDYGFTNVCDGDEPLWPEEVEAWAMQRYPGAFPEVMSLAEVEMYTNHVTESDDADENPLMPSQGGSSRLRESSADILHRPVGYDSTWMSLADLRYMRGRSHHSDKRLWWQKLSVERSQNKNYDVLATNIFSSYRNWWSDLIFEDLENGKVVIDEWRNDDYYERLLAVNNINQKLRSSWLYDYGEYDDEADERHYDNIYRFADDVDPNDQAYYARAFLRRPIWDYMRDEYHYVPVSHHGWQGYEAELEAAAEEEYRQETRQFHLAMNDDYYDPYYDGGYDYPPSDDRVDMGAAEKRWRDEAYQKLADASAWDEADFMAYERKLDAEDEAATLSRHGGARGWKAGHVAQLQLAEFA